MLYFAYGSNLYWSRMQVRCPSARFVCLAKLNDHRLAFTRGSRAFGGVADVVSDVGQVVWGVVYEIQECDFAALDRYEGFQEGRAKNQNAYNREEIVVHADGDAQRPMTVLIYLAVKEKNPPLPSAEYKSFIVDGAKHWELPADYRKQLEQIPSAP